VPPHDAIDLSVIGLSTVPPHIPSSVDAFLTNVFDEFHSDQLFHSYAGGDFMWPGW
jgi:hypothetical protein